MFIILLILGILSLLRTDKRSMAYYYTLILVISLVGNLFIKANYDIEMSDIVHFFWITIVLFFLILPWKQFKGISTVSCLYPSRLKIVSIFLIIFFLIQLLGCAVLAYYVITSIDDINRFKYVEGTTDFYYSLGINLRPFMLATLFYPMSYIMVPLHLYYLSKGEKGLSIWCFIASLLSVVYGFTYFSRAHLIHYILIYFSSFWLLRNTLPRERTKALKKLMLIGTSLILAYFLFISISRFAEYDYSTRSAAISDYSLVNSIYDYLVMWWPNSEELFRRFDWQTLYGQIAFQRINRLLSLVGIHIGATGEALWMQREVVLNEFSGSFIGVGEYFLYDFGPIISVFILSIYSFAIKNLRPRQGTITIQRVLTISILSLLPTFAIFYSTLDVILLTLLFVIPINLFIDVRI